jgi:hypothetical protein
MITTADGIGELMIMGIWPRRHGKANPKEDHAPTRELVW